MLEWVRWEDEARDPRPPKLLVCKRHRTRHSVISINSRRGGKLRHRAQVRCQDANINKRQSQQGPGLCLGPQSLCSVYSPLLHYCRQEMPEDICQGSLQGPFTKRWNSVDQREAWSLPSSPGLTHRKDGLFLCLLIVVLGEDVIV